MPFHCQFNVNKILRTIILARPTLQKSHKCFNLMVGDDSFFKSKLFPQPFHVKSKPECEHAELYEHTIGRINIGQIAKQRIRSISIEEIEPSKNSWMIINCSIVHLWCKSMTAYVHAGVAHFSLASQIFFYSKFTNNLTDSELKA